MEATFRPGTVDDAKACGTVCYEAFKVIAEQHRFPPDFPSPEVAVALLTMVLSRKDVYSVVADLDRRVVGSNFLWEIKVSGTFLTHPRAVSDSDQ